MLLLLLLMMMMMMDDARFGRPMTVTCVEVKEKIDRRIRDN
jgi:hypothetical protein